MANLDIPLSDDAQDWLDEQVRLGGYEGAGEYIADLVMQQRLADGEALTLEEVRLLIKASRASGVGDRSMNALFDDAMRATRTKSSGLG
jgi:antitoxin ParD1/3/4